jgi:ABC-2 type transport system permease protein
MVMLPKKLRQLPTLDQAKQHAALVGPYSMAPAPIMLATLLIGLFYCLDALYGERRDRSILFWKSLPVSDFTTVMAKASIPLVVLPAIALVLSMFAQITVLLVSSAVLVANGMSPAAMWSEIHFLQDPLVMIYGMTVHALWFAPLYGWLLLVSAWAKRLPVLWALLPLFVIGVIERITTGTGHFAQLLGWRFVGAMKTAFAHSGDIDTLSDLSPIRFLTAPGLWGGLLFAALCLAAAIRLRRNREPI